MPLTRTEVGRKLLHMAVGGFALLLRFMSWPQAALMAVVAFLFNWKVLPRVGGRNLWRGTERDRGYALGMLLYPVSVLFLILVFRDELWQAAAVWGVLALGDGMASLVGLWAGGPRLPWNPRKGWAGFLAFLVFGAAGAAALIGWTEAIPLHASAAWASIAGLSLLLSAACALVESMPTTLDDNLTVPLAGAVVMPFLVDAHLANLLANPRVVRLALLGFAINLGIAVLARLAGSLDSAGAASAVLIGTLVTAAFGLRGLGLMIVFFVVGSTVTRLGYDIKAARGIAQERGGARGWRNAWANGGVPAFLALAALFSHPAAHESFLLAYAAAVATAAADTCSSEVGKAYGQRTFLITTFDPVPPGTEGAVSLEGTLAGLAGAAAVAGTGLLSGILSPALAAMVAAAGLLGSLAESVIGTVAERKGWLGNDLLNALNTAIGAAVVTAMDQARRVLALG